MAALFSETAPFFTPPSPAFEVQEPDTFALLDSSMRERFSSAAARPDARNAYQAWAARARGNPVPMLVDIPEDADEDRYRNDICAWRACGIDIRRVVSDPQTGLRGPNGPCLALDQAALVRGFPTDWIFQGPRGEVVRQIATASSPQVARALGDTIAAALRLGEAGAPVRQAADQEAQGWSRAKIDALHHADFERFVAELLHRDGFRVEQAGGGSGDGGVDVLAYDSLGYPIVVQCKHFQHGVKRSVPANVARELFGAAAIMRPHPRPFLVTNGRFTTDCRVWSTSEDRVRLIDGPTLQRWAVSGTHLSDVVARR
ncbi:restriction endonuclease [Streptomyces sp. NPDC096311]|uniref:restriction endonuclease n=1 Tax=Streptomyces sp. NPDC096311 TaxID=3366083 RepID=UPI00381B5FBD